ncbi:unnamed protein product [Prorocentrum cordatum]|uniref:Uncharacterized protein n=1 Tax=Prorocentrum cordatum TaxID=2364126 RepID=A0ABN9R4V6_9DINO|nr:unnamed protein product [Polarella glacialis]
MEGEASGMEGLPRECSSHADGPAAPLRSGRRPESAPAEMGDDDFQDRGLEKTRSGFRGPANAFGYEPRALRHALGEAALAARSICLSLVQPAAVGATVQQPARELEPEHGCGGDGAIVLAGLRSAALPSERRELQRTLRQSLERAESAIDRQAADAKNIRSGMDSDLKALTDELQQLVQERQGVREQIEETDAQLEESGRLKAELVRELQRHKQELNGGSG